MGQRVPCDAVCQASRLNRKRLLGSALLALRAAVVCRACHAKRIPWLVENPREYDGEVRLFKLGEWQALCALPSVARCTLVQCSFGADYKKDTDVHAR